MISHGVGPILGALSGAPISPAQIVADTNDYAPTGLSATGLVRLDTDALRTITGLSSTGIVDGQYLEIANVGAFPIRLHDESASSAAANRLTCPGNRTYVLSVDGGAALRYDSTSSRWRVLAQERASSLFLIYAAGTGTWTNQPAATTEIFGVASRRTSVSIGSADQARVHAEVSVAGAAGATLGVQYSTDAGVTWIFLDGTADGDLGAITPQVAIGTTGAKISAWMQLTGGARGDVLIRLVGDGGDGVADPGFFRLAVEFR